MGILNEIENIISKEFKKTLYHGSNYRFDEFDMSNIGKNTDSGYFSSGIYFTENVGLANYYGKFVYECDITLHNPYYCNSSGYNDFAKSLGFTPKYSMDSGSSPKPIELTKHLKTLGYDGVVVLDNTFGNTDKIRECVVYDVDSIKIINIIGKNESK